ncbi:MAG: OmpA family protein [Actinomycetia bacterium]|nr:OmpA family protein [Actinomycetes bacterium]
MSGRQRGIAGVVALFVLLLVFGTWFGVRRIEGDIEERAGAALEAAGFVAVEYEADGQRLVISGPDADDAVTLLESLEGVTDVVVSQDDDVAAPTTAVATTASTSTAPPTSTTTTTVTSTTTTTAQPGATTTTTAAPVTTTTTAALPHVPEPLELVWNGERAIIRGEVATPAQHDRIVERAHTIFGAEVVVDELSEVAGRAPTDARVANFVNTFRHVEGTPPARITSLHLLTTIHVVVDDVDSAGALVNLQDAVQYRIPIDHEVVEFEVADPAGNLDELLAAVPQQGHRGVFWLNWNEDLVEAEGVSTSVAQQRWLTSDLEAGFPGREWEIDLAVAGDYEGLAGGDRRVAALGKVIEMMSGLDSGSIALYGADLSVAAGGEPDAMTTEVMAEVAVYVERTRLFWPYTIGSPTVGTEGQTLVASVYFGSQDAVDDAGDRWDLRERMLACVDGHYIVTGHTDSQGAAAANRELSRRRAEIVVLLMGDLGCTPESIEVRAAGETSPYGDNATAAGRQINRRVDIEIVPN